VQRYIAGHNLYESRPFEVDRFVLFSARPSRGGGPYSIAAEYPLAGRYAEPALRAVGGR
jgi:2'-5' RNA ligase